MKNIFARCIDFCLPHHILNVIKKYYNHHTKRTCHENWPQQYIINIGYTKSISWHNHDSIDHTSQNKIESIQLIDS